MSYDPSIRDHRITKTYFRNCSTDKSRSIAHFYLCARRVIANQAECTYCTPPLLFGRRPPQPNCPTDTVLAWIHRIEVRTKTYPGWYFKDGSTNGWRHLIKASHLSYTKHISAQYLPTVKVHGVFPSNRGYVASSPRLQFHRVGG